MQVTPRSSSLLRSQTSLLIFLAPCISSVSSTVTSQTCRTHLAVAGIAKSQQLLGLQRGPRQASSAAAAAAAAPQISTSEDNNPKTRPQPILRPSGRSPEEIRSRETSLLNRIRNPSRNQGTPRSREERDREIDSLLAMPESSTRDDSSRSNMKYESSVDYLERRRAEAARTDFAAAQQSKTNRQGRIYRDMIKPVSRIPLGEQRTPALELPEPTRAAATIKSRPSLGRTVQVMPDRGMDLGRALKSLEISCSVNNVRQDAREQRYYERPGLKRKRLKSIRWRKRFKIGFKAVVGKVKAMRRKGW